MTALDTHALADTICAAITAAPDAATALRDTVRLLKTERPHYTWEIGRAHV